MQHRNIPTKVLLTETLRLFAQFLLFAAVLAFAAAVMYFAFGSSQLLTVVVPVFFALAFFAAPLACSSVRAKQGIRLFSHATGKAMLFCFIWGCVVFAGFLASMQLGQGMGATALNYVVAMGVAGLFCAATTAITSGR